MNMTLALLRVLPWLDWLALLAFVTGWFGYVTFARRRARLHPSILGSTNRIRREWMLQATYREVRVIDGVVVQNLSTSPSFFASTTILIVGGLLAALSANEKASTLVREIPFAAQTSSQVFDLKLVLILVIMVFAFFRFTWSMRQYTFGALLVASAPEMSVFAAGQASREDFADRAGRVMGLAAESFNDGLRAYYFSFAAVAWFFSPWMLMLATLFVISILFRREFQSEMLAVLNG